MKTCTIVSSCESMRSVYPNAKNYETLAIRLAKSIRKNAGVLRDCDIMFWYGEDRKPSDITIKKLEAMGCKLFSSKCVFPEEPNINQATASRVKVDTDLIMWLDTDVYVNGDLGGVLDIKSDVAMAPDVYSHHTWSSPEWDSNWDIFYKHFNVDRPPRIISHVDKKPINFYFNNGVTVFRNGIGFAEMWEDTAVKLLSSGLPNCRHVWCMVASALAVLRGKYSVESLDEKFHYIYCIHNHEITGTPSIIHYQDSRISEVSEGDWQV